MHLIRRLVGAAVLLMGTAAPAVIVSEPAHAAACTSGVTVVVDRGSLGGGIAESCVSGGGGRTASTLFGQAGHTLTRVGSFPGAVCKVDGAAPPDTNCERMPPADKYWGLFWSDGTSSAWTFSSQGVDSLKVPTGGAVAFRWQSSTATQKPGVAAPITKSATTSKPAKHKKTAKPKPAPSAKGDPSPAAQPSATPSDASSSASASTTPEASASHKQHKARKRHVGATLSTSPSVTASALPAVGAPNPSATASTSAAVEPASSSQGGGLPGWVAPVVVVVVLGAGGSIALARRRLRG